MGTVTDADVSINQGAWSMHEIGRITRVPKV